jgi:putative ABC transport system ATP-binding protein
MIEPLIIEVQNLYKTYRAGDVDVHALRGANLEVAIARALVNNPAILLADEPTGNLDSQNTTAVLELLSRLNQQLGQTILMITHDQEAAAYAGRTIHMRDGRIV